MRENHARTRLTVVPGKAGMPAAHIAAIHIMNALALVLHLGPKAQGKPLRSTVTLFCTLRVMPASLRVPASKVRWQLFAGLHLGIAWCFICARATRGGDAPLSISLAWAGLLDTGSWFLLVSWFQGVMVSAWMLASFCTTQIEVRRCLWCCPWSFCV